MIMSGMMFIYLFCTIPMCFGIKYSGLNKFKYSFTKFKNQNDSSHNNPVYLLLSHKDNTNDCNDTLLVPSEVNVVKNNNYNDLLSNLKGRIFIKQPTLIKFQDQLNLTDKNTCPDSKISESILKLSEIFLLVDRVIVPVDYSKLVKTGFCGLNEFKLLGLLTYSLNLYTRNYPKLHFVIYNYHPIQDSSYLNKYQKHFIERQKYEINDTINEFLKSFVLITDSNNVLYSPSDSIKFNCSFIDKYKELKDLFNTLYIEDHIYYKNCMAEIEDEFNNKLSVCDNIDKSAEKSKTLKQFRFSFGEFNEFENNIDLYEELFNLYKSSYYRFSDGLEKLIKDTVKIDKLKEKVDQLVNSTIAYYDKSVKQQNFNTKITTKFGSDIRARLLDKITSELYKLNHDLISKLFNELSKAYEEDIKRLKISEALEEDLSDLIGKYDSKYCELINKLTYNHLKDNKLYDSLTHSLRMELVWALKEYSNRIMCEMIKTGEYYYKFSVLDGIRFIPNNKIINFVKKIINKINIPFNVRICYLSPNAFGFSNLFKSRRKIGPNTCLYFT